MPFFVYFSSFMAKIPKSAVFFLLCCCVLYDKYAKNSFFRGVFCFFLYIYYYKKERVCARVCLDGHFFVGGAMMIVSLRTREYIIKNTMSLSAMPIGPAGTLFLCNQKHEPNTAMLSAHASALASRLV